MLNPDITVLEKAYETLSCSVNEGRYEDALKDLTAYETYGGDINDLLNDAGTDPRCLEIFTQKLHDN